MEKNNIKIIKTTGILAVIILLGYFYLNASCGNKVSFYPMGSWYSGEVKQDFYLFTHMSNQNEPSTYSENKFKTRSEAVSYCINKKLGF